MLGGEAVFTIDGKPGPTHIFRPVTEASQIPFRAGRRRA
jgi:hypothetical protein